eukprot:ANDGO_05923.mRNA.1 hypothetical protein
MSGASTSPPADPLIMYVIMRQDLEWPRGALISQGCHAATALTVDLMRSPGPTAAEKEAAEEYFANLDSMHKVCVSSPSKEHLEQISQQLSTAGVRHKLWIEQPENIPSCIATAPMLKSVAKKLDFLRKLKLFS